MCRCSVGYCSLTSCTFRILESAAGAAADTPLGFFLFLSGSRSQLVSPHDRSTCSVHREQTIPSIWLCCGTKQRFQNLTLFWKCMFDGCFWVCSGGKKEKKKASTNAGLRFSVCKIPIFKSLICYFRVIVVGHKQGELVITWLVRFGPSLSKKVKWNYKSIFKRKTKNK